MKTLVLYASKHGAAREIAERIAKKAGNTTLYDLALRGNPPAIADFDRVIVGSGIYAGTVRKEVKEYVAANADALGKKTLGIFVCGLEKSREQNYLTENFPENVLKAAKSAKFLHGIFEPSTAGFFEKLVMRVITKQSGRTDKMDDAEINAFVSSC